MNELIDGWTQFGGEDGVNPSQPMSPAELQKLDPAPASRRGQPLNYSTFTFPEGDNNMAPAGDRML